ncbi:hypothetical protein BJV74DRAFT_800144 [Russula compacta]|nr:hypothetical protein BJV74DRAFT_800144 [Russula compacta]
MCGMLFWAQVVWARVVHLWGVRGQVGMGGCACMAGCCWPGAKAPGLRHWLRWSPGLTVSHMEDRLKPDTLMTTKVEVQRMRMVEARCRAKWPPPKPPTKGELTALESASTLEVEELRGAAAGIMRALWQMRTRVQAMSPHTKKPTYSRGQVRLEAINEKANHAPFTQYPIALALVANFFYLSPTEGTLQSHT